MMIGRESRAARNRAGRTGMKTALSAAILLFGICATGRALTMVYMPLPEVVEASDFIFTAVCESRTSSFQQGNIVTTYKLRPLETWKGSLAALQKDGTIEFSEIGGSIGVFDDQLRFGQHVGGSASMIPGEEVLLFAEAYRTNNLLLAQSGGAARTLKQAGSLMIVGRSQGRFSILTNPKTGQKHVSRLNLDADGLVANEATVRARLNQTQQQLAAQGAGQSSGQAAGLAGASGSQPTVSSGGISAPTISGVTPGQYFSGTREALEARQRDVGGPALFDTLPSLDAQIGRFESLSSVRGRVGELIRRQNAANGQ